MSENIRIPYGVNTNGDLVHIDLVKNGKNCKCYCPDCKTPLIAKNGGKINIHHFAHECSSKCNAGETILHLLAKELIKNSNRILLPRLDHGVNRRSDEIYFEFEECILEKNLNNLIPDIQLKQKDKDNLLVIEIKVTNGIDEFKISKIRELGIPVIEIDLGIFINKIFDENLIEQLHYQLIDSSELKTWIHHPEIIVAGRNTKMNMYLDGDVFIDKLTNNRMFPHDTRLSDVTTLALLWKYNGEKPFVVYKALERLTHFFYIVEQPLKDDLFCEGYQCTLVDSDLTDLRFPTIPRLECRLIDQEKRSLFNNTKRIWKFAQERPDILLFEEDVKRLTEMGALRTISLNEQKIKAKIIDENIKIERLTISEIWDAYKNEYGGVQMQNIETMELIIVINGKVDENKHDFNNPRKVWYATKLFTQKILNGRV